MTQEEIDLKHQEHIEILKAMEQLVVSQPTTYKVHNDRLQALRILYTAVTELKDLKVAEETEPPKVEKPKTTRKPRTK